MITYNVLDYPPVDEIDLGDYLDGDGPRTPPVRQMRVKNAQASTGVIQLICQCRQFQVTKFGWAQWCKHAQAVVDQGLDVDNGAPLVGPLKLILLGKPGVELVIESEPPEDGGPFTKLYLLSPDLTRRGVIGMAGLRDGRRAMIEIVYDWLAEKCDDAPKCTSEYHFGPQPSFDDLPANFHQPALADLVDILTTEKCRRCNADSGVPDIEQRKASPYSRPRRTVKPPAER